jgi:hypothetical protein
MQISILNGIFTDSGVDVRTSYPVNLMPVPKKSGVSAGYLRPAPGHTQLATGQGVDRGGINWNGVCYRASGTKLVTVADNGSVTVLGDIGGTGQVRFDYSFDRLSIASGGKLYYWNGTLTQVTDTDIGVVVDQLWVDGYFMTTDGESLVVTELGDPLAINPLKYGSSEADPDPVIGLRKIRNEVYAVNRYTMELFDNVGGEFFPFARIEGAQIQKGAIGTFAHAQFLDAIAFVGSGRNEALGIYLGANGSTTKLSTQEVDTILEGFTESQLSGIVVESRIEKNHQLLYIHLPDRTLVYDHAASQAFEQPVWHILTSTVVGFSQYTARNFVYAYNKWVCGDPASTAISCLDDSTGEHNGNMVRWEFGTIIVYNNGAGAIFHELELVALTGRIPIGSSPIISTSYSLDGLSWSQSKPISTGTNGQTKKRLVWFNQGNMQRMRIQRFTGDSDSHLSFLRLDAKITPLVW